MAQEYGIQFPLLEDKDNQIAKRYAGVSTEGFAFPAIFILKQDGTVFFQQVSEDKGKRVYVPELLEIVDSMTADAAQNLPTAEAFQNNSQLRFGLGGGVLHVENGDNDFAGDLQIAALHTLGSHAKFGFQLGSSLLPEREFRATALLRARKQSLYGIGEYYLQLELGIARRLLDDTFSKTGLATGLSLGTEIDVSPSFFVFTELQYGLSFYSHETFDERITLSRIQWQLGAGLKF